MLVQVGIVQYCWPCFNTVLGNVADVGIVGQSALTLCKIQHSVTSFSIVSPTILNSSKRGLS